MASPLLKDKIDTNEIQSLQTLAAAGGASNWLTAPAVVRFARAQGQTINAPTVYRILSRLRSYVEYRTSDGIRRFHLRKEGQNLLGANTTRGSMFIAPGTPWSTKRELRNFLKESSSGFLFVVDPYVSEETLDVLGGVRVPIKILATQVGRKNKEADFIRDYQKFKKEKGGCVELRQISSAELHGRYIFTDSRGWIVDHSLQDLGAKPALVLPLHLETVYDQVRSYFLALFSRGNLIL